MRRFASLTGYIASKTRKIIKIKRDFDLIMHHFPKLTLALNRNKL